MSEDPGTPDSERLAKNMSRASALLEELDSVASAVAGVADAETLPEETDTMSRASAILEELDSVASAVGSTGDVAKTDTDTDTDTDEDSAMPTVEDGLNPNAVSEDVRTDE